MSATDQLPTQADLDKLPDIVRQLRAAIIVPPERRLWGLEEIADYSGYSVSYVRQHLVCQTSFPEPIHAAGARSNPRWVAGEVMCWFENKRKKTSGSRQP